MSGIGSLDVVALRHAHGCWPAGTTGTVVELLEGAMVLIELVGPDGAALDLLAVTTDEVQRMPGGGDGTGAPRTPLAG